MHFEVNQLLRLELVDNKKEFVVPHKETRLRSGDVGLWFHVCPHPMHMGGTLWTQYKKKLLIKPKANVPGFPKKNESRIY